MGQIATDANSEIIGSAHNIRSNAKRHARIWIDMDNSPHVPFFIPIIEELEKRGHSVLLTARDCFQVNDLIKLSGMNCAVVGRHYGKNKILKVLGTFIRAAKLFSYVIREKPDIAVSHGSRAQMVVCAILRVRNLVIDDYEHSNLFVTPDWLLVPEVIRTIESRVAKEHVLAYPGIKEDAYVPRFTPDPSLKAKLGLSDPAILVTVRPPADEAHYHNPESEGLFKAAVEYLMVNSDVRMVLVPRTLKQAEYARATWPQAFAAGNIVIPDRALNGLNLIWWSDLVISGGGTMNREAAALGVPVYSIFRGPIGAVDRHLVETGRLTLLERIEDIPAKLILQRRGKSTHALPQGNGTLKAIVTNIINVMELPCSA